MPAFSFEVFRIALEIGRTDLANSIIKNFLDSRENSDFTNNEKYAYTLKDET